VVLETKPLSPVDIDQARACAELPGLAQRTASLIRSVPDGDVPIPDSEWTTTDAAAHLVVAMGWYIDWASGGTSPLADIAERGNLNGRLIVELGVRDKDRLARMLLDRIQSYLDATAHRDPAQRVVWHAGSIITLSMVSCLAVGEMMVHGYDIAKAAKKPWLIDPKAACLFVGAIAPALPLFVNTARIAGLNASYELRLRGGPAFVLRVDSGTARVERPSEKPVDVHVSADPVAAFLLLYGRVSQWPLMAQGKIFAWGRKPWLGLKFTSLMLKP
jgi:hypothetical protein